MDELEKYLEQNQNFIIGKKMLDSWRLSLQENTIKEVDDDTLRSWKKY